MRILVTKFTAPNQSVGLNKLLNHPVIGIAKLALLIDHQGWLVTTKQGNLFIIETIRLHRLRHAINASRMKRPLIGKIKPIVIRAMPWRDMHKARTRFVRDKIPSIEIDRKLITLPAKRVRTFFNVVRVYILQTLKRRNPRRIHHLVCQRIT